MRLPDIGEVFVIVVFILVFLFAYSHFSGYYEANSFCVEQGFDGGTQDIYGVNYDCFDTVLKCEYIGDVKTDNCQEGREYKSYPIRWKGVQ